jgi:hypothetical protein
MKSILRSLQGEVLVEPVEGMLAARRTSWLTDKLKRLKSLARNYFMKDLRLLESTRKLLQN